MLINNAGAEKTKTALTPLVLIRYENAKHNPNNKTIIQLFLSLFSRYTSRASRLAAPAIILVTLYPTHRINCAYNSSKRAKKGIMIYLDLTNFSTENIIRDKLNPRHTYINNPYQGTASDMLK
jgi:hypothetical protein